MESLSSTGLLQLAVILMVLHLVMLWALVVEAGVQPVLIEPGYPGGGGRLNLLPGSPGSSVRVNQLGFVQSDGALHEGVVIDSADPADAASHVVVNEFLAEGQRSELTAGIA